MFEDLPQNDQVERRISKWKTVRFLTRQVDPRSVDGVERRQSAPRTQQLAHVDVAAHDPCCPESRKSDEIPSISTADLENVPVSREKAHRDRVEFLNGEIIAFGAVIASI